MTQCPDTIVCPTDHVASNIRRRRRFEGGVRRGLGRETKAPWLGLV
jgi:hypothetical protein